MAVKQLPQPPFPQPPFPQPPFPQPPFPQPPFPQPPFPQPPHLDYLSASSSGTPLCRVVALGASAGGLQAISTILAKLPADFPAPVVIVQHLSPHSPSQMADILSRRTALRVKEAEEGDLLQKGTVYVAPPAKHLIVRPDERLSLSDAEKVHHSRPAVDVLFSSLASSVRNRGIGVVLTGGDGDGSQGCQAIKAAGGVTIAQDVPSSQEPSMPRSAVATGSVDFVLPLSEIAPTLLALVSPSTSARSSFGSGRSSSFGSGRSSSAAPATDDSKTESVVFGTEPVEAEQAAYAALVLDRVQAAWRSADDFPGDGAGTQQISRLMTRALAELDDSVDALRFAEQALVSQNRALEALQQTVREERLRYKALLEVVSDAIITTDLQGIIRAVNLSAARLLGRNPKYMVGRPFATYVQRSQHLALNEAFEQELEQAREAGAKPQMIGLRPRRGGDEVGAMASPIEGENGQVIGLHWLVHLEALNGKGF